MKLFSVLLLLTFSFDLLSQPAYRKETDIRNSPMDILEYYLIIPGKPYNSQLYDEQKDFTEFEFRKKYLKPIPDMHIVVDKKNAFMSIEDEAHELDYKMELTYFTQPGGIKVIALYEDQAGGDGNTRSLIFYKYVDKKFVDVTHSVMPEMKLKDFCTNSHGRYEDVFETKFALPRVGTTIIVEAKPVNEYDERLGVKAAEYYEFFNQLNCKTLELLWDKTTGKFSVKR